jgi:hypothetical protein
MDAGQINVLACLFSMEEHLGTRANEKSPSDRTERTVLTERDARALKILCSEVLCFSSKLVGESNPTISAMLAYIRDEVALKGVDETI